MERTFLAILLFWAGVCNAQVYTATKNDCRLEFSTGGQVRTSLLLGDTRYIDISGGDYVQFFDGVQSIYLRANQIGNFGSIAAAKSQVDTWIALCTTSGGAGATGPTGATGATGATGPTGPAGTYTPGDGIAISGDTISADVIYRDRGADTLQNITYTKFIGHKNSYYKFRNGLTDQFGFASLGIFGYINDKTDVDDRGHGLTVKGGGNIWLRSDVTLGANNYINHIEQYDDFTMSREIITTDTLRYLQQILMTDDGIKIEDREEDDGIYAEILLNAGNIYIRPDNYINTEDKYLVGHANGEVEWQHFTYANMDSTARNALTPVTGMAIFCTDCPASDASTGVVQVYNGTAWKRTW